MARAVALVGSHELLMMAIRGAAIPADVTVGAGRSGGLVIYRERS